MTSYGWPAATLNPAQLTLSIHTDNLSLGGYELYSWAPVRQVVEADQGRWKVMTSRGSVIADKVVFATNAYSQALIPELKDLLTPMRGGSYAAVPTDMQLRPSNSRLRLLDRRRSLRLRLPSEQ